MLTFALLASAVSAAPASTEPQDTLEPLEILVPSGDDYGGGMMAMSRRRMGLKGEIVAAHCDHQGFVPRTVGRDLVVQYDDKVEGSGECKLVTTGVSGIVVLEYSFRAMTEDEQLSWEARATRLSGPDSQ